MSDTKITTLAEAAALFYGGTMQWFPDMVTELSDKELLTRPAPGRSHIFYIVGHLAVASDIAPYMNGSPSVVDQKYKDLFDYEKESLDDATDYPPIVEIVEVFKKGVERSVEVIKTLTDGQLNSPSDDKSLSEFLAKASRLELINGFGQHVAYHIGQIVTIIKILGKEPWPKPE